MKRVVSRASSASGCRLLALAIAAAIAAATPAVASDDDAARVEDASGAASIFSSELVPRRDGRRTMGRLPANLGRSAIGAFHADSLVPFLVGGAGAAAGSFADDEVRESVNSSGSGWGRSFQTAGGPTWGSLFTVGMFAAGRLSDRPRFRALTYDMLDAVIVNFGYSQVIKVAVGRERPNGENNQSFPSGHASNAFALAAVAEQHYGWKIGVPGYVLAALVGASRIQQDKHYVSDVVAGATLGYIVARAVVRVNSRPLEDGARAASLQVSPIVGARTRGLRLVVTF